MTEEFDDVLIRVTVDDGEAGDTRLAKVEAQLRVLSEAVIAIGEPADAIAPAIEAVKAEMATPSGVLRRAGPPVASAPRWNECPACGSLLTDPLHRSPDGHGYKYFVCSVCTHQWERIED
jgi:hypothetical protein